MLRNAGLVEMTVADNTVAEATATATSKKQQQ